MNGQAAQISTRMRVQYDVGPLSQSWSEIPTLLSRLLTIPSGCNMVRHTVATTKDGSTYGMRKTARTRARPRYLFCVTMAAATPIGRVTIVLISANETLIQMEAGRPLLMAST